MELLLALGLIASLLVAGVISFGSLYQRERFPEAARQVEALVRLARADAAARGRKVRMVFDAATLHARLVWEPNPLSEPGTFLALPASWAQEVPNELVRFRRCQRVGPSSAVQTLLYGENEDLVSADGGVLQAITFYSDGTCDSAVIELADWDDPDGRVAVIEMDGESGNVSLRILTPLELEEYYEQEAGNS